jgi:phosphoribosylformylglycinamidine synthase
MSAVCEASRNLVAVGARPVGVTNCLNFGNPDKPEVFWQLRESVAGLAAACEALGVPVVSGNVSLYNDSGGVSVNPTAVIGMVGVIDDVERHCSAGFTHDGDVIALVGALRAELGGSEYQAVFTGVNVGPRPELDMALELRVQRFVLEAVRAGLLRSVHDCAAGGLAVALAECCLLGGRGARIGLDTLAPRTQSAQEEAGILFGECQSRFVVSFPREHLVRLQEMAVGGEVPFHGLGSTGGDRIQVTNSIDIALGSARDAYERALA